MPFLIAIAGGSGSGKTTLALTLMAALPAGAAAFLSEDWYYADLGAAVDPATHDFDDVAMRDHDRLIVDLQRLRRGETVHAPSYCFHQSRRTEAHATEIAPAAVIVAEGAHLLCRAEVAALFDLRVFVDTPADVRFIRRLLRDQAERGRSAPSVIQQYLRTVRPAHLRLIEPSQARADLVIADRDARVREADPAELLALAQPVLTHPGLMQALAAQPPV
jgi:uridine kinase